MRRKTMTVEERNKLIAKLITIGFMIIGALIGLIVTAVNHLPIAVIIVSILGGAVCGFAALMAVLAVIILILFIKDQKEGK